MAEYIDREALCYQLAKQATIDGQPRAIRRAAKIVADFPAADVRPVVVCANCEHNNHCLTQEFVEDCGKIPLDRNTFFCADGERVDDA